MRSQGPSSRSKFDPSVAPEVSRDTDVTIPFAGGIDRESITRSGKFTPDRPLPAWSPVEPSSYVGSTVDNRYFIERLIGEGGMGVVYRGRHKLIDKKVAIKILRGDMARDAEMTERFLQEARAASTIGNPHIIDISDFGVLSDGATYFAMEYLEGRSLTAAMQGEPLSLPRILHVVKQIADGLAAAHSANIVHRDMKPDNVFLIQRGADPDFVKILDFGIAKVGGEASRLTRAGSVFGTPHYMAPEQASGSQVDARADVYALGVILYEMTSGKVPFDADSFMGIAMQHMHKAPVPVREMAPERDIPLEVDAIVLKLLAKEPADRYQTMGEVVADLERFERGEVPLALREMRAGGAVTGQFGALLSFQSARFRRYVVMGGVLALLLGAVVFSLERMSGRDGDDPPKVEAEPPPRSLSAPVETAPVSAASVPDPAPPEPEARDVIVITSPLDAMVSSEGTDLGHQPIVKVPQGKSVTVSVTRANYLPQTVSLDGAEPKVIVKLVPVARGKAPKGAVGGTSPTTTSAPRPSDVLGDPWRK